MNENITLNDHIIAHCNESMAIALSAERYPSWARSCPEMIDIDFIRFGLLRCIGNVDSGRDFNALKNQMRLTSMTYNLMRVFEEVSKTQDLERIHPSDKKYSKALEKRNQIAKKKVLLLTRYFFSQESYVSAHIRFGPFKMQ